MLNLLFSPKKLNIVYQKIVGTAQNIEVFPEQFISRGREELIQEFSAAEVYDERAPTDRITDRAEKRCFPES